MPPEPFPEASDGIMYRCSQGRLMDEGTGIPGVSRRRVAGTPRKKGQGVTTWQAAVPSREENPFPFLKEHYHAGTASTFSTG